MKKFAVLSAVGMLALAGAAYGQGEAAAAATLKMRIVPVDDAGGVLTFQNDTAHNDVLVTDLGTNRIRRFSVQYQIQEGAGFEGIIASLASMQFNVTGSVAGGNIVNWGFDRAALSRAQGSNTVGIAALDSGDPAPASDATGATTGTFAGVTGLHRAWRGGLSPATAAGNALPSNGTIAANGIFLITPLSLTQLNQFPANDPAAWYGLYDFTVIVGDNTGPGDAIVNLMAAPVADAQTGNSWGGYEDGDTIPRTSRNSMTTGASFRVEAIPAPGSLALVGLGGLIAARRRRA
jgi:hypothetical protein